MPDRRAPLTKTTLLFGQPGPPLSVSLLRTCDVLLQVLPMRAAERSQWFLFEGGAARGLGIPQLYASNATPRDSALATWSMWIHGSRRCKCLKGATFIALTSERNNPRSIQHSTARSLNYRATLRRRRRSSILDCPQATLHCGRNTPPLGLRRAMAANSHPRCLAGTHGGLTSTRFRQWLLAASHVGGSSLNGLKTLSPGRRKSLSLPVAIVSPCLRAVAAM